MVHSTQQMRIDALTLLGLIRILRVTGLDRSLGLGGASTVASSRRSSGDGLRRYFGALEMSLHHGAGSPRLDRLGVWCEFFVLSGLGMRLGKRFLFLDRSVRWSCALLASGLGRRGRLLVVAFGRGIDAFEVGKAMALAQESESVANGRHVLVAQSLGHFDDVDLVKSVDARVAVGYSSAYLSVGVKVLDTLQYEFCILLAQLTLSGAGRFSFGGHVDSEVTMCRIL